MSRLIIDATSNKRSTSFTQSLIGAILAELPDDSYDYLDLYKENIPDLSQAVFDSFGKMRIGQPLSVDELDIQDRREALLSQFLDSDQVIILYPLYNYNVPSKLKDYMDNILVTRKTIRYTDDGEMKPLLAGQDRKVLFIQFSGHMFSTNKEFQQMDFAAQYLDKMFEKMGFENRSVLRAEGMEERTRPEVEEDVLSQFKHWENIQTEDSRTN